MGKLFRRVFGIFIEVSVAAALLIGAVCLTVERADGTAEGAKGSSFIAMDGGNGRVLKAENEHLRLPMASTTKTMTALIVAENCLLDEVVEIPQEAVGIEGSSIYLKQGEKLTVKELLYGLMLRSGNDAAVALAIHTAGSVKNFASVMNVRAENMGLKNTHFVNPHGLHDDNHYTSAYDLCLIGCYAMHNPVFRDIVSTKLVSVGTGESKRYFGNKNKILFNYEGGNGIKTGFTKNAGRCLIASAERGGKRVVSVVLNRPDMFNDCKNLMDYGFGVLGVK